MDKTGKLNFIELGIDDMTNLVELSDDSLLYNLQTRYSQKIIYTYIGSILISINPYTELNIYDKKQILRYQNKSMQEVPPHLFGVAEINYSKMMLENENQVIVISGESGAGKTESFKRILRYLAYTSGGVKEMKTSDRELSNDIANKILDSTPLLESFGNAKTIRNDNSSRFGKYVEIFFDNGTICGSRTTNYLLEKSRIVNINPDERGYHIFYELLQGLDSFGKSQYYLKNVKDYAYLNNAINFTVKDRDDAANLKEFMSQWSTLGLSKDDLDVALRIVSAVLHLGNIKFSEEEEASSMVETENVSVVAKMLKVDTGSLISCLTMKTTDTVKDIASSPVTAEQASNLRDTLAKHLYSELFDWIVQKVNESLNEKTVTLKRTPSHLDRSMNSPASKLRCIAMLDIYGFENFPLNSLEQLCINYANETLQQFFNKYVFELEQAEYKQEGISWHYVTYPDNQPIIDLLSAKPSGIIQILNDECSIPQGSDDAFLIKCNNVHQKNQNFEKPKKVHPPQFIIRHFAGNIFYNVKGFLEKNRDLIRKEAIHLIEHCGVEEIATMFRKKKDKTLKNPNIKARTPAVMADFQNSLGTLLNKMKMCQPWFIRCLKPNNKKEALSFNKEIVMDQMRYTGILETVKIRKSGFPIRIIFNVFLSRFYLLQSKDMRRQSKKDPREACLKMLPNFGGVKGKDFEVGKSKLFLKEHFARHLEMQVRLIRERSAIKIQRKWRAYWKIREIIIKNRAATRLQAIARGFLDRRRIRRLHIAIVKLQAFVRMKLVRIKFIENHPEFLKYSYEKVDYDTSKKSSSTTYRFPAAKTSLKSKKTGVKKGPSKFNYNLLKIPIKLAFLLEKSTENYGRGHELPNSSSIAQTGRAQNLFNRDECKLPEDINEYAIEEYMEEFGNNVVLESKVRPISNPLLKESQSATFKDDSLNAHKLILRLIYVDTMPWPHRFLIGSYLSYMASTSPELQVEILIQIISETISTSERTHLLSDGDSKRISRGWTLLGNILSHIIPIPQIFNHVLQYISKAFGVDQACTCQEKLLQFVNNNNFKIPRLFPACNLEWGANSRGTKTSLKVYHPDGIQNSVHLNSFSTAECLANNSLCFRLKKFRSNKGWSISIVSAEWVIDCSGHNYVFDVVSAMELSSHWAEVVGYGVEHKFLLSKKDINSEYIPTKMLKKLNQFADIPVNKSKDTIISRKSMDSWVDKYFDKSFRQDDASSHRVHDFIHGLEDELKAQRNAAQNPSINPNQLFMSGLLTPQSTTPLTPQMYNYPVPQNYYYNPYSDKRLLEEQLNSVELQNKVIQSSIENELLQSRLKELRQERPIQLPNQLTNPQFSYQAYQPYNPAMFPMMQEQFLPPSYLQNQHMQPHYNFSNSPPLFNQGIPTQSFNNNTHMTTRHNTSKEAIATSPSIQPQESNSNGMDFRSDSDGNQAKKPNLIKKKSIVKYSELGNPSNMVVDDSRVLPEPNKDGNVKRSHQRAAEVPKVNVANRAAFLDKFFLEKNYQTPETTKVKRIAPSPPVSEVPTPPPHPPSINHVAFVPPPPPLINQPKLIPRPSIHSRISLLKPSKDDVDDNKNDTITEKDLEDTFAKLNESFDSLHRSQSKKGPEIKKRKKRRVSSSKSAIILSGLSDMRYYTYTNVPWLPMVKIELFLPNDIQNNTILNPVIFCQIIRDLVEFPCIRWVGSEKRELLLMLGNIKDVSNVKELLATPSNIMLKVIDRAQNCELYFSRFYHIRWLSTNTPSQICHWLTISHSGLRFVEQNLLKTESGLRVINCIRYSDLKGVYCDTPDLYDSPQKLVIKTKTNKTYEIESSQALSALNLIHEFVGDQNESSKYELLPLECSNGLPAELFKHKKNKRRLLERTYDCMPEPSLELTTLDVHNQRIPISKYFKDKEEVMDTMDSTVYSSGDLIDFMILTSKHRDRNELENVILKWKMESILEPLLPSLNNNLVRRSIELYQSILVLSGDIPINKNFSSVDYGMEVFKIINKDRELNEEVILQIIKQINGNPNSNNRLLLWYLLSTIIMFFGVSKRMRPYFIQHLKKWIMNRFNLDKNLTTNTLQIVQKTISAGTRREMPLENELKHLLGGVRDAKINIYLPGDTMEFDVTFNSTVGEVIKNIGQYFGLNSEYEIAEYSLRLVEVDQMNVPIKTAEFLKRESYLFDSINYLAKNKKFSFIFYFSRSSWIIPIIPKEKSQKLISLLFNQLSNDVFAEKWMIYKPQDNASLKHIVTMAFFSLNGQGYPKCLNENMLVSVLPSDMFKKNNTDLSKTELINMINATPSNVNTTMMKDRVDYQRKFIELALQLPRYGWIRFPILRLNRIPSADNLIINFTPENISISNETTNERILKLSLGSFTSFQVTMIDKNSAQFTIRYNGIQDVQFTSNYLPELVFLLNQYQNIRNVIPNIRS